MLGNFHMVQRRKWLLACSLSTASVFSFFSIKSCVDAPFHRPDRDINSSKHVKGVQMTSANVELATHANKSDWDCTQSANKYLSIK